MMGYDGVMNDGVWCGVVWCGEVWCGVVWCGVCCCCGALYGSRVAHFLLVRLRT